MVIDKPMLVWLGATLLLPSFAHALTVGRLDVRSALGEPFYAELLISDLGSADPKNIQASLASDSDVNQLGVQRNAYSSGLQISHRMDTQGRVIVSVRSNKPLTDPFLDVVIKIKDGTNTRLQHLTALVDIPKPQIANPSPSLPETGFTALAVTPVQQIPSMPAPRKSTAAAGAALQAVQDIPLIPVQGEPPELKMPAIPLPLPVEPLLTAEQQARAPRYTVQRNDSLWQIASKLQNSHQQSVGQLMGQIRQLNPNAFIKGNPNQLKQNANLILPPLPAEQDLTAQQPLPEPIKIQPPAPIAAKVVTPNLPMPPVVRRGRLPTAEMILLAPNQAGLATGNTTQAGRSAGAQPFSRDLLQRVGQARRHTASLRQEVIELDAQVTANDQKIAMQNTKIAELQQRLKARREAQRLAQSGQTRALPTIALTAIALISTALLGIEPVYAAPATAPATQNTEQVVAAGSSGSMTWIFVVIAVLIVAAIAAVLMKKKDKPAAPAAKPQARPEAAKPRPVNKAPTPVAPVAKAATPVPAAKIPTPAPIVPKTPTPVPVASQPVVAEQPKDALVDAQAFIAMERYPQAVGLLSKAIDQQPERSDLYLALLEIYLLQEDHDAFESLQARLDALEDPFASDHALQLQSRLSPRPVIIAEGDQPITFTKVEIPRELPVEEPVISSSEDDHPLEFSLDKPISDGDSPALELGQDDNRAFQLDTPLDIEPLESLDSLEAAFKANSTRPSLAALVGSDPTEAPLTDLDFDFSPKDLYTNTDHETDHSVLSDALSELRAFSLEESSKTTPADEQPVDLDFDFDAGSFELEDDKASKKAETTNLAAGFDDLDFTLPAEDQLQPLEQTSSLNLDEMSRVTPDHALDDQASRFDALLEQSAGNTPASLDSQRLTSQLAAEFPFLADAEDQATNLELAQRYASLGELSSAHELLDEVLALGSDAQKDQARQLKAKFTS